MKLEALLDILRKAPLVASVQAPPESPVDSPNVLYRLSMASLMNGVSVLRLQGSQNIRYIQEYTQAPTIGLIKKEYRDSGVYITPTRREVGRLLETSAQVIALDGTRRPRPGGEDLPSLIKAIHQGGRLAMADCDSLDSALYAAECGADLIGTTLAGYTEASRTSDSGPALDLLREIVAAVDLPIIAEGRYAHRWQVEAALAIGAVAVVVGGALNDPFKTTNALLPRIVQGPVGAVDIGGTWLRFGIHEEGRFHRVERLATPADPKARLNWIREKAQEQGIEALGISTGGTVDPFTGEVWEAKPIIPGHVGTVFGIFIIPSLALNDGLATAWGHAQLPRYAGKRVVTLALGTGVGCGMVSEGKIWTDSRGRYPRLNDLSNPSFEDLLGGAALTPNPSQADKDRALQALESALDIVHAMYLPDHVVVGGSVGLSDWIAPKLGSLGLEPSPFGTDAGLHGAAALARVPPFPLRS